MINVEHLKVEFGVKPLFADVSFVVNDGERVCLVGKNGAGKSTMLGIIAGNTTPTDGIVSIPQGSKVGYLPQVMELGNERTLIDEVGQAFSHLEQLQQEFDKINLQLVERTDYESPAYTSLIEKSAQLSDQLQMSGVENCRAEMERTLCGLGFSRDDFSRPTSEFSGGWRMRVELAKILLMHPDVLLLDEPTNHLDIESIGWLENFLKHDSRCSLILVSHDRAFINNVTTRTLEIDSGKVVDYKVKYDEYVKLRAERREQQLRAYENQQKEIANIKAFVERFRYQATKAIQVQSRLKQLERMVPVEVDEVDNSRLRLRFNTPSRSGDYPVICQDVGKTYGNHNVFNSVDLTISRGEKVAFVGKNGEGKSTLVKCIMNEIPFDGNLKIGHNVEIGYYAQNQAQLLDGEQTVFDTIDRVAFGDVRLRVREILGAFMFGGEAGDKKVKVLSGGERSRLAMIKLLLQPVNFLILDEPTNHLDMRTKDILKDAIRDFEGTVVVVSHDRDFLDGLVSKVYEFAGGKVREHIGGIYDFLHKKQISELNQLDSQKAKTSVESNGNTTSEPTNSAISYERQKELRRNINKLEKQIADAEATISKLEKEIKEIETTMSTPEGASDLSLIEKYQSLSQQLDCTMAEWESLGVQLEEIQG